MIFNLQDCILRSTLLEQRGNLQRWIGEQSARRIAHSDGAVMANESALYHSLGLIGAGVLARALESVVWALGAHRPAAILAPAQALCCAAAVVLECRRPWHAPAGLHGGSLFAAGLGASFVADVLAGVADGGVLLDAGSLLTLTRAVACALYALGCARSLARIRDVSWASAASQLVLPIAAAFACADNALADAPPAGAVTEPRFLAACAAAAAAVLLSSVAIGRWLAFYLAPHARRDGGGSAPDAAGALVPATSLVDEANRSRARLFAYAPLAVGAAGALLSALAQLRCSILPPPGREADEAEPGWVDWLRTLDLGYWASVTHHVLDVSVALSVSRCARFRVPMREVRVLWRAHSHSQRPRALLPAALRTRRLSLGEAALSGAFTGWGSGARSLADLQVRRDARASPCVPARAMRLGAPACSRAATHIAVRRRAAALARVAQAERVRRREAARRRQPVVQEVDEQDMLFGDLVPSEPTADDPSLQRDDDGDLAHEFWLAASAGGFVKAK